jgi:hypothetical protein
MLHIHNGDSTADTAKQTSLPGEHFAFRESLITGPTPFGLSGSEWRNVRAAHLCESYGGDLNECEQGLLTQEEKLASFSEHEEVVLWFEHDLFCQLHLLYLLDWFSQRELRNTKLSLICIGEFPGKENFRGLGELNPEQLTPLFPARQPVTSAQLSLAASTWRAYRSPYATAVEHILRTDTSALPFLDAALRAHLERFPSTKNGLGRIENRALQRIGQGVDSFIQLFGFFVSAESVYGFGDAQFWLALQRLIAAREPVLTISGIAGEPEDLKLTPEIVSSARFQLTGFGESVRKGEADFLSRNGVDLWLGGVHLEDVKNLYRWNEESRALEFSQT